MSLADPSFPPDPTLDRILSEIHLRLRQGNLTQAKTSLDKAKELAPDHPLVLEVEGDIAFTQGRFHTARQLYQRAHELEPGNAKIEEKYATAILKIATPQLIAQQILTSGERPKNAYLAALQSTVLPGVGQLYNGEWLKGLLLMAGVFLLAYMQSGYLFAAYHQVKDLTDPTQTQVLRIFFQAITQGAGVLIVILQTALWIYAIVDAALGAKRN